MRQFYELRAFDERQLIAELEEELAEPAENPLTALLAKPATLPSEGKQEVTAMREEPKSETANQRLNRFYGSIPRPFEPRVLGPEVRFAIDRAVASPVCPICSRTDCSWAGFSHALRREALTSAFRTGEWRP